MASLITASTAPKWGVEDVGAAALACPLGRSPELSTLCAVAATEQTIDITTTNVIVVRNAGLIKTREGAPSFRVLCGKVGGGASALSVLPKELSSPVDFDLVTML